MLEATEKIETTDKVEVPDTILENEVVGYGISSWVLRFDAVAKCYLSKEPHLREREIAVYKRLTSDDGGCHDAIVPFYGVLDDRSVLLQFARNGSIRQYYTKHKYDARLLTKITWAEQAASAIAFLHSKNVQHGDISCNNIFLDEGLNAKLGDFAGSSIDGQPYLTVYETSHYLPDVTSVSVKREIFALGSTFYEIITGHKPFEGTDDCTIENLFRKGHFPDLQSLPALGQVILRCWKQQYDAAEAVLRDVQKGMIVHRYPDRLETNLVQNATDSLQ